MKTVLVFGTFDVLHPGHRFFLSRAREYGDRLVASVARDSFVRYYKGRNPVHDEEERRKAVLETGLVDEAYLSDEEIGTYSVIERTDPEVICLGHDQHALGGDLEAWLRNRGKDIRIESIDAFEPHRYKSSLLNSDRSSPQ